MKYELQVNELQNKEGDLIGAEVLLYERNNKDELLDCLAEHEIFIKGNDFDDIDDRNFIIERELTNIDAARDYFKWYKATLIDYI